jgi:hypothetical protein
VIPEQSRLVQELLVLAQQNPRLLAPLRAFAQEGHDVPRAANGLVVIDAGEIAAHPLGQGAHPVDDGASRYGDALAYAIPRRDAPRPFRHWAHLRSGRRPCHSVACS